MFLNHIAYPRLITEETFSRDIKNLPGIGEKLKAKVILEHFNIKTPPFLPLYSFRYANTSSLDVLKKPVGASIPSRTRFVD